MDISQFNKIDLTKDSGYYKNTSREITYGVDEGTVGLIVGESGTSKTKFSLQMALCVCGMSHDLGIEINSNKNNRAAYIGFEDTAKQIHEQTLAIKKNYEINDNDWKDITSRLDLYCANDFEMDILNDKHADILIEMFKGRQIAIVDNISNVIKVKEDVECLRSVINKAKYIAAKSGCAIFLIHHVNKPTEHNKDGDPVHRIRGGSSLVAGARATYFLNSYTDDKKLFNRYKGIDGQIALRVVNCNSREKIETPFFFNRVSEKDGYSLLISNKKEREGMISKNTNNNRGDYRVERKEAE